MIFLVNSNQNYESFFLKKTEYKIVFRASLEQNIKIKELINNLKKLDNIEDIKKIIINIKDFFSLIIWSKNFLFCTVDQVCSYPLIYSIKNDKLILADNTSRISKKNINTINLKAISLSGYGISNLTNFYDYNSLKPCEYLFIQNSKLIQGFWFSTKFNYNNKNSSSNRFEKFMTSEFTRLKKNSEKATIVVPLSAGIDSRFIVSCLKYFNIKNFKTFTYGFSNLRDFNVADKICKKINIENKKLFFNINNSKKVYGSSIFKKYLQFNNLGISLNNPGDFLALHSLREEQWLKPDDIIINGQAGDFISGNHLPRFFFDTEISTISELINKTLNYIISKHYNLWCATKITENQQQIKQVLKKLYFSNVKTLKDLAESYETFEYENRQVKWVVGQQKVYDFFNLNWTLPLWHRDLIKIFYREISLNQRKNQIFYKNILIRKNLSKLWKTIEINPKERFFIKFRIIRLLLKFIFIFLGKKRWHKFEKKFLYYFFDPAMLPLFVSYKKYSLGKKMPRNAIAFFAEHYVNNFKKIKVI